MTDPTDRASARERPEDYLSAGELPFLAEEQAAEDAACTCACTCGRRS